MAKRLFVSVDLSDPIRDRIAEVGDPIRDLSGLRCTDPDQAHVTLTFLGDVQADRLPAIEEAIASGLERAEVGPFRARFGGFGVFPSFEYISVIWVGVRAGATEMERLHRALEHSLEPLGIEGDDHDFTPHVTIARMDHAEDKETVQRLVRTRDPDLGAMDVDSIHLTESTLTNGGPVYDRVRTFQLDPPSR